MTVAKLNVTSKRREAAVQIVNEIQGLERTAQDNVISTGQFAASLLDAHRQAALPPTVGMEVIALVGEVHAAASANCARLSRIHMRLREIGAEHGFPLAGLPDCPDDNKRAYWG